MKVSASPRPRLFAVFARVLSRLPLPPSLPPPSREGGRVEIAKSNAGISGGRRGRKKGGKRLIWQIIASRCKQGGFDLSSRREGKKREKEGLAESERESKDSLRSASARVDIKGRRRRRRGERRRRGRRRRRRGISIPRRGPFPPPFFPPSPLLPSPHIHSTQIQRIRSSQPRNPPARIYRRRNQTPPSFVHTTPTPSNLLVALRRNDDDDYDDDGFRDE